MTLSTDAGVRSSTASSIVRRRARRRSRLVHALRWLLPVLIVGLLGLIGALVVAEALRSAAARPKETPTEIRMVSPHFVGHDDQGRAFDLAARQAARDDTDMQRVILAAPVLVLDIDGPSRKTLTADTGVYDENTRLLHLKGHVRVDDAAASTVATDVAEVDTRAGTVSGVSPIVGHGPNGAIEAGGYTASEKGDRLILRGGVHAVLKGR